MTKTTLTDGSPVTPDHREIDPATGMQKGYVVLSAEERAKGFVEPVRRSYVHQACGAVTTMGQALAETYARTPEFYSGTFCVACRDHFPVGEEGQFVWDGTDQKVGTRIERPAPVDCYKLDTPAQVFFYEQDFYVLSNFSAFTLRWRELRFDTSEAAYHWEKFFGDGDDGLRQREMVRNSIHGAPSAHDAFKIAQEHRSLQRADWPDRKVNVMREILWAKVEQHEYVRRKLLATGNRELIEDSWRDDFWGWGPNRDGQNILGKLWMEIRGELRGAAS